MYIKSLTALALAATALGAEEKRQVLPTDSLGFSVLSVLATAIPQSDQSAARANATAFALSVASSISAGTPPAWYQALPSDVKSYLPILYPAAAPASTTAAPTSAPTTSAAAVTGTGTGSVIQNGTVTSVSSATLGTTGGANSQAPSSTGGPASTGAAAPAAVVGAGVAGAFGFLAMLAL